MVNILSKTNLFLLGIFFVAGYVCFSGSLVRAMNNNDSDDIKVPKKSTPLEKKEGRKLAEDLLERIKGIPKGSLEKISDSRLSSDARHREDKFWSNAQGNNTLLESNKGK